MTLRDTLRSFWYWKPGNSPVIRSDIVKPTGKADFYVPSNLGGDRLARAHQRAFVSPEQTKGIIQPPDPFNYWRNQGLDEQTFSLETPARLTELMCDLSPDVSRALWDYLLFSNPGFTIKCYKLGTDQPDERAKAVLDEFLLLLQEKHGTLDIIFERLFMGAYIRGAFFAEIIFDKGGRIPLDIATPDPAIARFKLIDDPILGSRPQLGYLSGTDFIPLDRPTVKYLPVHPLPNSPYGRPMMSSALFSTIFLIGMMNDIRRVIAQQGYPRIHISIDLEQLVATMPTDMAQDPEVFQAWVKRIYDDVKRVYASLQPDDAYISTSMISVNRPIGAVDSTAIGAVDNVIEMLERHVMRALKSMPLLMGVVEGMSEANANRQWEIHVAGIKSMQHRCETMLGGFFNLALQAQGIQSSVVVRFAELRTAERLRDEMTRQLNIANSAAEYLLGIRTLDEIAMMIAEHPAVLPEPLAWPKNFVAQGPGNDIEAEGSGADSSNIDNADDQGPVGDDRSIEFLTRSLWPFGMPVVPTGTDHQVRRK
jgi:hypothetical protein